MYFLLKVFIGVVLLFFVLPRSAFAVTIASQTQAFPNQLIVWQVLQELGTNLSGTAQSFAFRVSTSTSNANQFDYTAQNTRIYDKTTNTYIYGCIPSGANPADRLRGLTFNTTGVPDGFEDVTIDFSCNNYDFIPGHKYVVLITNANVPQFGGLSVKFAAVSYSGSSDDYFTDGGLRYANGNIYDYSNNSGSCDPGSYNWQGTDPWHNGCYVWTTAKDDLYFVLNNNAPPPKLPVIFIPGIGGSELKAAQDIIWSKNDGHGGTYSHGYAANEKIWVNQDEAVKLGDDDYFDILRLKTDGVTAEASLSLTGNLNSFGYGEIDSFFTGLGYIKGTNFFEFNYDWRKDVRSSKDDLDSLIDQAKQASGQSKVNLVVHSMGGLIARYYISDSSKATKINKLIELGVPHLGSVYALKTLIYGTWLARDLYLIKLGIIPSEVKDVFQNLPSGFQLMASKYFFNFYDNSTLDKPFPFRDDRDIDNNNVTGSLTYDQIKSLLSLLNYNMTIFNMGEQFHNSLDSILNQTNGTKIYEIVGTGQSTLGQIHETWWVTWPVNLIPKTDEIYINGDDTVPLYSASLKSDSQDISGATKIYYVEQRHGDMPKSDGISMQTVKSILNDDNSLPTDVKDQKITLDGEQISLDDGELDLYDDQNRHCGLNDQGEMEENIPDVSCTTSTNTKHAFVKKKAAKVKVKATRKNPSNSSKTTNIKLRTYSQDKITKTTIYKDINIGKNGKVEFTLDPSQSSSPNLTYYPDTTKSDNTTITSTSEVNGNSALDQTSPTTKIDISGTKDSSGIYTGPVTITLTGTDTDSGILRIEYSLDNGQTIQVYTDPFTISTPGKNILQVKAIDKSGNEEIPQSITIEIAAPPAPASTSTISSSGSSDSNSSNSNQSNTSSFTTFIPFGQRPVTGNSEESSISISSQPSILGATFENPHHISDQLNITKILEKPKIIDYSPKEILSGLLLVSGGIIATASLGFAITFLKPFPGKM